jgi:hypothetical protein
MDIQEQSRAKVINHNDMGLEKKKGNFLMIELNSTRVQMCSYI